MGMTITEKILARAAGEKSVVPGQLVDAKIDVVMCHDVTTPPATHRRPDRPRPSPAQPKTNRAQFAFDETVTIARPGTRTMCSEDSAPKFAERSTPSKTVRVT